MGSQSCSICLYCGFFPIIGCEVCSECLPAILCFRHGPDTLGRRLVWIRRGGAFRDGSRHTRRHYSSPGQAPGGFCRFLKRKCKWGRHFLQEGSPASRAHPQGGGLGKRPPGIQLVPALETALLLTENCRMPSLLP